MIRTGFENNERINKMYYNMKDSLYDLLDHNNEYELSTLELPESCTEIEACRFENWDFVEYFVWYNVRAIGREAFSRCTRLEEIELETVLMLGERAFADCTGLKEVWFGNMLDTVKMGVFSGCESLERVTIPEGVGCIEEYAFVNCPKLKRVELPDSVTEIGERAFGYIRSPENGEYRKVEGFEICGSRGGEANNYACKNGFAFIEKDSSGEKRQSLKKTPYVALVVNNLFSYENDEKFYFPPDGSAEINDHPFFYNTQIFEAYISGGVTVIGESAFEGCLALDKVTICSGVKVICEDAFYSCEDLESVTVPESVTKIEPYAFGYYEFIVDGKPECRKKESFIIRGKKGSEAERYANENGFKFEVE